MYFSKGFKELGVLKVSEGFFLKWILFVNPWSIVLRILPIFIHSWGLCLQNLRFCSVWGMTVLSGHNLWAPFSRLSCSQLASTFSLNRFILISKLFLYTGTGELEAALLSTFLPVRTHLWVRRFPPHTHIHPHAEPMYLPAGTPFCF